MSSFTHLPGVQVATLDGGLVGQAVPTSKAVIVFGTAGQGPANTPYTVTSQSTAAQLFGFSGNLIRGLEEVALGGADNITLYRIGTKAATLAGVGTQTGSLATTGVTIAFGSVDASVATDYSIWYNNGVLYVWNGAQLVYANDVSNDTVVDTGDLSITGTVTGNLGLKLGSGSSGALANAITIAAAAALSPQANQPTPVLVAAVLGVGMSQRDLYIALAETFNLLDVYPVDEVVCMDAVLDNFNVAFYVSSNSATVLNNPATNADALDWLKVTTDSFGNKVFQWASESVDSSGNAATPMSAMTLAARQAQGFGEVNFAHLIGTFCQKQEAIGQQGTCLEFLGTNQPATLKLTDIRTWVGFLPVYDPTVIDQVGNADIKVTTDGSGILGNPYLAGCTSARLNSLTVDYATGRSAGLFLSGDFYDSPAETDANGNPIDIGAYVHTVADIAIMANGFANGYASNMAAYAAGYTANLDEKVNLTNKPVQASQLWKPNSIQLDSATQIGVNFLRFKGNGNLPVFTHGQTAATNASDYKNLLRQRIKGLVVDTLRLTADPFIGGSSVDGLSLQSLQTALNNKMGVLQKRGYIGQFSFSVSTTAAQQRIGHANIFITFQPADELIQLDATIAVSLS